MFIKVYASGTNVQRLAKCSTGVDGVIYTAYSQLETEEPGIIKRRFFCTHIDGLKREVEALDEKVQPNWIKIWEKPMANKAFIAKLLQSLVGDDTLRPELNLSHMADESVDCFMLLVSADKAPMKKIAEIAAHTIPDWHVKILNGDHTTNIDAEPETKREINEARIAGKKGVLIIANQMGSRSYSIPEIQATVIAYDRGSVDATQQKVSRCLTPGLLYTGNTKTYGYIVDLSFDPNRAENIERLVLEEAIQVQRSENSDFNTAVRFVLSSIDLFKMNEYGCVEEVTPDAMFKILGDNDVLLKVADVAVDVSAVIESGLYNIIMRINTGGKGPTNKKPVVGDGAITAIKKGDTPTNRTPTDQERTDAEKRINDAIRALNMSATSVYDLANGGSSYRECLSLIAGQPELSAEFEDLFGVSADNTLLLVKQGVLSEAILDVIVQNSQHVDTI